MSSPDRQKSQRFIAYLEPLQRQLAAYCARALLRPDETADVLQSAIGSAFRDFDRYAEGTNFRAWMFRYVALETLNRNRATRRLPTELGGIDPVHNGLAALNSFQMHGLLDDPETVLDHCDGVVASSVNELTEQERRIFLLRAIGEFKYREIAEILDIPMGTVMGLLSRARSQLRGKLIAYGHEHGLLPKGEES